MIDGEGSDYTIKHGNQMITAHVREKRKLLCHQAYHFENPNDSESKSERKNLLIRKEETMDEDALLINRNVQIKDKTEIEQCKKKTTCMGMLDEDLTKKQSHTAIGSVEQTVDLFYVRIFVGLDCITAYRRQLVIDYFNDSRNKASIKEISHDKFEKVKEFHYSDLVRTMQSFER